MSQSFYMPIERVIALNQLFSGVLLDRGKLESALARPLQSAFGVPRYPAILERAAVLMESIAMAHAFLDGNKRTAWAISMMYLDMHGISIVSSHEDDGQVLVDLVTHKITREDVVCWLQDRIA